MQKWLVGLLIDKVLGFIFKLIKEWIEAHQAKQKAKQKAKEIINETKDDPIERARRLGDFLN